MILNLSFKNLFRNKRRTLSTGLAICVGFVGLNLLGAYIYRTKMALDMTSIYSSQRGHYIIYKKDGADKYQIKPKLYSLNQNDITEIDKFIILQKNIVEYTGMQLTTPALLSNGQKSHPVVVWGFDPNALDKSLHQPQLLEWARDWILDSQLNNSHQFKEETDLLSITGKIAEILSLKTPLDTNDDLQIAARTLDGDLNAVNARLGAEHTTGLQFLEDTIVLLPLSKVQELIGSESIESFSVFLKSKELMSEFLEKFNKLNNQNQFDIYRFDDPKINELHLGTMGFLYVMGFFFVFLICTATSLTIINSLTMSIIERTREIGTLRAVGFTRKNVLHLFLLENIILCFISMAVGVVLASAISFIVNHLKIFFFPPGVSQPIQFVLRWNLQIAAGVFVVLFSILMISAFVVIKSKLNSRLINLLTDQSN